MFSFYKKIKDALRGIVVAIYEEQSFRLQIVATIIVVGLIFSLPLSFVEISILVVAIMVVLGLELTNSIVERILDIIEAEHHPKIKDAKDIMAGAVILAACGSFIIGAMILLPYLIKILG